MLQKIKQYRHYILAIGMLSIVIVYVLLRKNVALMYNDAAPDWFATMANNIYPRFEIEKHRFPLSFFLEKADQVIIRFLLVTITVYSVLQLSFIKRYFVTFLSTTTTRYNVAFLRVVSMLLLIQTTYEWYFDLSLLHKAEAFYRPIMVYQLLHIPFPSPTTILIVYLVFFLSAIATMFNIKPVISSIITVILFIYMQGLFYCFEKMDHGYTTFTYALLLLPCLLYQAQIARLAGKMIMNGWALNAIQLVIVIVYFITGLEKLLVSHFTWASPDTFRAYLHIHHADLGMWVAKSDLLCRLLPVGALVFQLGFISVLFWEKLKIPFLIMGGLFHLGTVLLFDISSFWNPWVFTYIFFIDWELPAKKLFRFRVLV